MIAAFNFIHVGFESGAGGWLTTYSARFPEGANSLLSATPAFFLFFVIGRGIAPIFLRFLSENKFLFLSLFILTTGTTVILSAETFTILVVGAGISGFGTSAIFPANMARFTKIFGENANAPSDAAFSVRHTRRRIYDMADRFRFRKIRKSAKRDFRSSGKWFDLDSFTNYYRFKLASQTIQCKIVFFNVFH